MGSVCEWCRAQYIVSYFHLPGTRGGREGGVEGNLGLLYCRARAHWRPPPPKPDALLVSRRVGYICLQGASAHNLNPHKRMGTHCPTPATQK